MREDGEENNVKGMFMLSTFLPRLLSIFIFIAAHCCQTSLQLPLPIYLSLRLASFSFTFMTQLEVIGSPSECGRTDFGKSNFNDDDADVSLSRVFDIIGARESDS